MDYLIDPYRFSGSFILTSRIYPIESDESLNASAEFGRGWLWERTYDFLDASASFISGVLTLTIAYRTYGHLAEDESAVPPYRDVAVDASASFNSGVLTVFIVYKTYSYEEDFVDASASFISGVLTVVIAYVTYNHPPEDFINASAQFVGGVLV